MKRFLIGLIAWLAATNVLSQTYPSRPVRIVVPLSPGAEAGVPGYEATLWLSVSGPAGMPAEIVQRLNGEIDKALRDPEVQANFHAAGVEATSMGPQELNAFMRAEHEKWGRVVRETGASVN